MKKTVIIADDNAVLVADLKEFFASVNDYDVVAVAENGKEALAAIEKFDPDFLLLDIVMPELDGFGVLSALTKPRPTVIMMSQLNTDAFVQKALRYGAKYFLAKPFDLGLLLRTLDDFSQENDAPAVHPRPVQRQSVRRDRSLDEKIANLFISVGIPAHIKGYQFLREAIKITVDDPEIINSITKRLYPSVAAAFNTTPLQGGTRHPPCHRSRVEPRQDREHQQHLRHEDLLRQRETHQRRVHRPRRRQDAAGRRIIFRRQAFISAYACDEAATTFLVLTALRHRGRSFTVHAAESAGIAMGLRPIPLARVLHPRAPRGGIIPPHPRTVARRE